MASSQDLVHFLKQPDSYPHRPASVDHHQTHISHLFMAGEYVYKVKKPLDLGFLDFSTLDRRKHYCHLEVELNRRLCADIYLGVSKICQSEDGYSFEESDGCRVVEYAVRMKRLSDRHFLIRQARKGHVSREILDRVVDKLTSFYRDCEPDEETLKWGSMEQVKRNTDENFSQTTTFIGHTIEEATYNAIRQFTDRYYERHGDLFKKRMEQRRIVDGHGDLHLEHIHVNGNRVCIYDCVEFTERFRCLDWAADLAFLAMDLDYNSCYRESRYFMDRMSRELDDPDLAGIADFYKCYRAYVRGKVKSIESTEEEVPDEDRKRAAGVAADYFNLALRYALLGSGKVVMAFMGEIASGKSSLAGHLADRLGMDRYSSDRTRKKLAGLPLYERPEPDVRAALYSQEMSAKTYGRMMDKMEESLAAGRSVILDATFGSRAIRKQLTDRLKGKKEVRLIFIETVAPPDLLKKRLEERETEQHVVSDARLEDFDAIHTAYAPPDEIPAELLIRIDTSGAIDKTIEEFYKQLMANDNVEFNIQNL